MITFLDTETTGLPRPIGSSLDRQPYMTELSAIQTNAKLKIKNEINTLIKPPIPIPKIITKMTGINDGMVRRAPTFAMVYKELKKMFKGSHTLVVQNYSFDHAIITFEVMRIGKKIPFPKTKFCTVEQTLHIRGRRLKLVELYGIATGIMEIKGAHRARNDVLAMIEVYRYIMKGGTEI